MHTPLLAMLLLATPAPHQAQAVIEIRDRSGGSVGTVRLTETATGLLVEGDLHGLPPGEHGIHFHAVGKCEPPFESAGPHFDPAGRGHGFRDPRGPHAGDLPNIHVGSDGRVRFDTRAAGLLLARGKRALRDADGAALVIHDRPDDYATEPSGASGDRIACGALEPASAGRVPPGRRR